MFRRYKRPLLGAFVLLIGVLLGLAARPAAARPSTQPAADLSGIYYVDGFQSPGVLYRYDPTTGTESAVFVRQNGRFSSFTLAKFPDELYYSYRNDRKIFRAVQVKKGEWSPEEVIYVHTTYVKDVAFGPGPALYFSEATGCGGAGKIYRLDGTTATLYYTVRLSEVGCWAGDFAFDEGGVLYLANGNRVPASLYKVVGGHAQRLYTAPHSIMGLSVHNGIAYYTDFGQRIYYLDINAGQEYLLHTKPSASHLSEADVVGFTPSPPTSTPTPTATATPTSTPTPTTPPSRFPGQIYMDKVRYRVTEQVYVTVELSGTLPADLPAMLEAWVADGKTGDAEPVRLYPTQERGVYRATKGLPLSAERARKNNGRLEVQGGDFIMAFYWWTGESSGATGDIALISGGEPTGKFSYRVDPGIFYGPREVPGRGPNEKPRPVAVLMVPGYPPLRFGEDMLIYRPRNEKEKAAFLQRRHGQIVQSRERDNTHVVRVDPKTQDLDDFVYLAEQIGFEGEIIFSSEDAARLFNMMLEERLDGLRVTLNPQLMLFGKPVSDEGEGNDPTSTDDDLTPDADWWANTWWVSDPNIRLDRTWMLAGFLNVSDPVNVALIDGGFRRGPDVPPLVAGWDFADNDGDPFGENPVKCSGDGDCPWHGAAVWGVAGAVLNNGEDVAGVAGQVARPMFYRIGYTTWAFDMDDVLRQAVNDGADVINISGGFPCRLGSIPICDPLERLGLCATVATLLLITLGLVPIPPEIVLGLHLLGLPLSVYCFNPFDPYTIIEEGVQYAVQHQVPVVAAAGNPVHLEHLGTFGPYDVSDVKVVPCVVDDVICVGGMDENGENLYNYGQRVNIWAPSGLLTSGDPSREELFWGTSAATPYITGLVALMKALNPNIAPQEVLDILQSTAWASSADARVHHAVNAYAAFREAARRYSASRLDQVDRLCPSLGWDETAIQVNENPTLATSLTVTDHNGYRTTETITDAAVHEYNDVSDWFAFDLTQDVDGRFFQVQYAMTTTTGATAFANLYADVTPTDVQVSSGRFVWPGHFLYEVRKGSGNACYRLSGQARELRISRDPFDPPEPPSPPRKRLSGNDSFDNAAYLDNWYPIQTVDTDVWEMQVTGLTFHSPDDKDYFWLRKPDAAREPFQSYCEFAPREGFTFWLEEDDGDSLAAWIGIFDRQGNSLMPSGATNPIRINAQGTDLATEGMVFGFEGDPVFVEADGYHFRVRYNAPSSEEVIRACNQEHDIREIIEADLARGGTLWWLFPRMTHDERLTYPLTCDPRVCDPAQGLAADYLAFYWRYEGGLRLAVQAPAGSGLRVRLLDTNGNVVGEARPLHLRRRAGLGNASDVLSLEVPDLTPGLYLLKVSDGKQGTPYNVHLEVHTHVRYLPVIWRP